MCRNATGTTKHLICKKGLQTSGFWDPAENPWGNDGGHIVFMDGHVTFYDNVAEPAQLVQNSNAATPGDATADITAAINSSANASVLDPSGTLSN